MAFGDLQLVPGVNLERTPTLLQAGYNTTALVRYRDGLVEKLGGNVPYTPAVTSGVPRELHAFRDLNGNDWLAEGTTAELNLIDRSGTVTDITPLTFTTNTAPDFSTTIGSPTAQITDTNGPNPIETFHSVFLNTPVAVGGLVLWGLYGIPAVGGAQTYDITASSNATATVVSGGTVPVFTTTSGSSSVNVLLTAHGLSVDDIIFLNLATAVGGLSISGRYRVITVVDANNFTIRAANQAASNATVTMNGGNVQFIYYVAPGPVPLGTGYGFGPYGAGGYGGSGSGGGGFTGGTHLGATSWSISNWGQILLSCPYGDGVFQYDSSAALQVSSIISTAPARNGGIFVSNAVQILICWGSTSGETAIGVERDPLLIRWSDQGDFNNFVVSSDTQAGSFRLPTGNAIIGAMQVSLQMLFWTDIELWQGSYIQPPLVFGFNKLGAGCGLVGQHAACELRGAVYWMGRNNFWVLAGQGVEVLKCSVWDAVFQDVDLANISKSWAWANSPFNEAWFFYPSQSGGTGECDRYVKFNVVEQAWDLGPMKRSAGLDTSILGMPIAASPQSRIFQHEIGYDDSGQPISWSFTTGYFYIAEGEDFAFVDQIIPDFKFGIFNGAQSAAIKLMVNGVNYPGDTPRIYGPYTFNAATPFVFTRMRHRQFQLTFSGEDLNTFIRLGKVRFRFSPDGRR
jgi:hypothetical protein